MTALDIITGALRRITAYTPGEQLSPADANDALDTLNDLLDSWSTEHAFVYASPESVFLFTSGKFQYSIGQGGDFQVDALTGAGVARPLRITSAFTRIAGIDFTCDIALTEEQYTQILLKNQPAPWPIVCWYNPTFPLGLLNFFPAPSGGGELHLFTDQLFTNFISLTQAVNLPQGYARALKWALAAELCPEYGIPLSEEIKAHARDAMLKVKSLNQTPVPVTQLDSVLSRGSRTDASWILTGGFR